jgi:hypothetical protein
LTLTLTNMAPPTPFFRYHLIRLALEIDASPTESAIAVVLSTANAADDRERCAN